MEKRILKIANKMMQVGFYNTKIRDLSTKKKLTEDDQVYVLDFLEDCQEKLSKNSVGALTSKDMKDTILNLIGYKGPLSVSYATNMNKSELKAVYDFVVRLPTELLHGNEDE
jgi:hypothetical protein